MVETVLSFHGGKFWIDEGTPVARNFYIGFEGLRASHAGEEIDLRSRGVFKIKREVEQSSMLVIDLVPGSDVYLSFNCRVTLARLGGESLDLHIDGGPSCIFCLGIKGVDIEGQFHPLSSYGNTVQYHRTSGESPSIVTVRHTGSVLEIPFSNTLQMSYLPVTSDPQVTSMLSSLKPPRAVTDDRVQAWRYQLIGYSVYHENGKAWRKVHLTEEERLALKQEGKERRQREFEKNCGC